MRLFFEQHAEASFSDWDNPDARTTINRAGFRRKVTGDIEGERYEYYVLSETFRQEICVGINYQATAKLLVQRGILKPGSDGRPTRTARLPGMEPVRYYHINPNVLESDP